MDKHKAVIDYIKQCDYMRKNPLFFNMIEAGEDKKQIVTVSKDKKTDKKYIDGSVEKQFDFTIIDFKQISHYAILAAAGKDDQNVSGFLEVQSIIDWINEQEECKNYPNFGNTCEVQKIEATSDTPNLNGIGSFGQAAQLAKYSVTVRITYIDNTKKLWK